MIVVRIPPLVRYDITLGWTTRREGLSPAFLNGQVLDLARKFLFKSRRARALLGPSAIPDISFEERSRSCDGEESRVWVTARRDCALYQREARSSRNAKVRA